MVCAYVFLSSADVHVHVVEHVGKVLDHEHVRHHVYLVKGAATARLYIYLVCMLAGNTTAAVALQLALKFNGGGHVNHSIFWTNLSPDGGGQPVGMSMGGYGICVC